MTDNRTTERLMAMLEERGVEYKTHGIIGGKAVTWHGRVCNWVALPHENGLAVAVYKDYLTPEQAIAATMGNRPTKSGRGYYTDRDGEGTHIMCDDCGGYIGTVEEITATLGSGECEMEHDGEIVATALKLSVWFCSECGSPTYNDMKPFYCQYCGAKVVDR